MNEAKTPADLPADWIQAADAILKWHWQSTEIAGQQWPLAVATDPDAMLIEACERQDAGEKGVIDPFWATTWRAAAGLDQFLDRLDLSGRSVLELGCGTGHVGIGAALRGATVLQTDGVEDPLHLVRMSHFPLRDRCRTQRLRFGVDHVEERFSFIIGSDVTYLRELWPELLESSREHLAEDGVLLLSDPFRIIASEFREWIRNQPWEYKEHTVSLADDRQHPIRVMELRPRTA